MTGPLRRCTLNLLLHPWRTSSRTGLAILFLVLKNHANTGIMHNTLFELKVRPITRYGMPSILVVCCVDCNKSQAAIEFTTKYNIRLVIRNTGHDYLGKSTGAGALSLWTHHMKGLRLLDYHGSQYNGPAIRAEAGVELLDAYVYADLHGLMIVGGNCPTVGLAGGFTQGGGIGPLSSRLGLAADQVLEWSVVLMNGSIMDATPTINPDLYWALCGGGGGTFAIVISVTIKAYDTVMTSGAMLHIQDDGSEEYWNAFNTFIQAQPQMVDAGVVTVFFVSQLGFALIPASGPGLSQKRLDKLLQPTVDVLQSANITYTYHSEEYDTWLQSYVKQSHPNEVIDAVIEGCLVSRDVVQKSPMEITKSFRNLVELGFTMSGVTFDVSRHESSPSSIGANPYWRKAILSAVGGLFHSHGDWESDLALQSKIQSQMTPVLESLGGNGGAYLNEANFATKEWKRLFYGLHYSRLDQIKRKYDPNNLLYAHTGVGSDRFILGKDGRVCQVISDLHPSP
jgi:hypothetical protein